MPRSKLTVTVTEKQFCSLGSIRPSTTYEIEVSNSSGVRRAFAVSQREVGLYRAGVEDALELLANAERI